MTRLALTDLTLDDALSVELMGIVVDQCQIVVLAGRIIDTEIGDLATRHSRKLVWYRVALVLLRGSDHYEES
jgi:hypothetical protein